MEGFFRSVGEMLRGAWTNLGENRGWALVLALGAAATAISLQILSRTKWGQSKPLAKCIVLSVVAHIWLLMYAYGTRVSGPGSLQGDPSVPSRIVALDFEEAASTSNDQIESDPSEFLEDHASDPLEGLAAAELPNTNPDPTRLMPKSTPSDFVDLPPEQPSPVLTNSPPAMVTAGPTAPPVPGGAGAAVAAAAMVDLSTLVAGKRMFDEQDPPREFALRTSPQRKAIAQSFGASEETEDGVAKGLAWLARTQQSDGSWNAAATGAGQQTRAIGQMQYQGIGRYADSGITALSILAFLGAGHTHVSGEYARNVRAGLEYLVANQLPSGDLSGNKQNVDDPAAVFARMYCHGIGTLALAEAFALTGDPSLVAPMKSAANYTLRAQDPTGGGWRYRPGEAGDLSQFGWQAMALKSIEHNGFPLPPSSKSGMNRFLASVTGGKRKGLASYRPGEATTSAMTAESLFCHIMLDIPMQQESVREAREHLLSNLPGTGDDNVYYWYYATLSMFQFQDEAWQRWNGALKNRLLALQEVDGSLEAGSWPPDQQWGGYGGRVYSTAMGCLCLEVYYRYLPLYQKSNLAQVPREEMNR